MISINTWILSFLSLVLQQIIKGHNELYIKVPDIEALSHILSPQFTSNSLADLGGVPGARPR